MQLGALPDRPLQRGALACGLGLYIYGTVPGALWEGGRQLRSILRSPDSNLLMAVLLADQDRPREPV